MVSEKINKDFKEGKKPRNTCIVLENRIETADNLISHTGPGKRNTNYPSINKIGWK